MTLPPRKKHIPILDAPKKRRSLSDSDRMEWQEAMQNVAPLIEKRHTHRRLLKAKMPAMPEALPNKLDLHGMTQAEAYKVLKDFLEEADKEELREVTIITGRGRGILRHEVPRWLARWYEPHAVETLERPDAYRVRLRRKEYRP